MRATTRAAVTVGTLLALGSAAAADPVRIRCDPRPGGERIGDLSRCGGRGAPSCDAGPLSFGLTGAITSSLGGSVTAISFVIRITDAAVSFTFNIIGHIDGRGGRGEGVSVFAAFGVLPSPCGEFLGRGHDQGHYRGHGRDDDRGRDRGRFDFRDRDHDDDDDDAGRRFDRLTRGRGPVECRVIGRGPDHAPRPIDGNGEPGPTIPLPTTGAMAAAGLALVAARRRRL